MPFMPQKLSFQSMHPKISRLHPPFELSCNCIKDSVKGDLVITKSVSRFCRNTLDGLEYIRRLKRCGVGVYFEKENTNTLYMPNEMILTFLMSQAQAESESMSSNIQWGYRARFKQGIVHYNFKNFLGYRRGEDGEPEIDEDEAPTIRRIFARYLMGQSVGQICLGLTADGCKTARGSTQWSDHTVRRIQQNGFWKSCRRWDLMEGTASSRRM